MPDLNKQALVNLLIDSPLREPIKINLIDIVNNTSDADLLKVYPTIVKELEIFQKATDRRLKLAQETIDKLGSPSATPSVATSAPVPTPTPITPQALPPLPPLPPLPTVPTNPPAEVSGLSVPPLDLPPLPTTPQPQATAPMTPPPTEPQPAPVTEASSAVADEAALSEIQKELDALKSDAVSDSTQAPAAPTPPTP